MKDPYDPTPRDKKPHTDIPPAHHPYPYPPDAANEDPHITAHSYPHSSYTASYPLPIVPQGMPHPGQDIPSLAYHMPQNWHKRSALRNSRARYIGAILFLFWGLCIAIPSGEHFSPGDILVGLGMMLMSGWYLWCRHMDTRHLAQWRNFLQNLEDNRLRQAQLSWEDRQLLGVDAYPIMPSDLIVPGKYRPYASLVYIVCIMMIIIGTNI